MRTLAYLDAVVAQDQMVHHCDMPVSDCSDVLKALADRTRAANREGAARDGPERE
jgi:hypothetical protein